MHSSATWLLLLTVLLSCCEARRATNGYATSYVFLTAKNIDTGKEVRVCANYLQYRLKRIAPNVESSKPVGLSFWRHKYNETRICPLPSSPEESVGYNGTAVPLLYRIESDGTACTQRFNDGVSSFRNASQFEVDELKKHGAENAILLLEKGKSFIMRWHDYLFSDFYDPYINATEAIPTFFLYYDVLQKEILTLANDKDVSRLRLMFHRPPSSPIDLSMVVIWLLAVGCVTGGGVWAFFRHRAGKDKMQINVATNACSPQSDSSDSSTELTKLGKFILAYSNFFAIVILMVILVGILMIGFFFRPILVTFFNVLLVVFGTASVYSCIFAIFSSISLCECCTSRLCTGLPQHRWLPDGRPTVIQVIVFMLSLAVCVVWFVYRRSPYAFVLLDFINVTLCLHILKSLRLPSVKWITVLMLCMFIYDAVMVFVTPLLTSNGCSVMLEVATGIDCSANGDGYPIPPIDAALPEKFPMLMQVPHFDPMMSCIDLEVERGFQMTILGLGDIIIPGYLITHCFTMGGFTERARVIYGVVCSVGYGLGLILTFFALAIMNQAQPALIYLVPCTLLPICVMACIKGQFWLLWNGSEDLADSTASLKPNTDEDTGPLNDITSEEATAFRQA